MLDVYSIGVAGVLLASPLVFLFLWIRPAPYGRHRDSGWGPVLPGRAGWVLMECPTLLVFLPVALRDPAWPLVFLWVLHYGYRTLVYPFRLPSVRPMPAVVVACGLRFQLLNSTTNGYALSMAAPRPLQLWSGAGLFLLGQLIHHHGDHVLMGLRAPGETHYRIPTTGLYRWICNVSYLGELITWCGWALATGTGAGVSMAVFTAANLIPRARHNHTWYRETFPDYPKRRTLLPGIW